MSINITNNNKLVEQGYGLKTKNNELWKTRNGYRVNWDLLVGESIATNFGEYSLVSNEKNSKTWYFTLKNNTVTFRIKREQARKNKRLPKTVEYITNITNTVSDTILCLPIPKEQIDIAFMEMNKHRYANGNKPYNLARLKAFDKKLDTLLHYCAFKYELDIYDKMVKKLKVAYHPDKFVNEKDKTIATERFQLIENLSSMYRNRRFKENLA